VFILLVSLIPIANKKDNTADVVHDGASNGSLFKGIPMNISAKATISRPYYTLYH